MADLKLNIGADTTELEGDLKKSGRTVKQQIEELTKGGPNSNLRDAIIRQGGIPSLFVFLDALSNVVQRIGNFIGGLIDQAREFRNLSSTTGMSGKEISQFKNLAAATGIGVGSLSNSYIEFNRKIAEAKIKGSELNNVLVKMGVNYGDINKGSFKYIDALNALADAHAAGTDEATLDYYAQIMLGSSYKELIPLINQGRDAINKYATSLIDVDEQSARNAAALGDYFSQMWEGIKNVLINMVGGIVFIIEHLRAGFTWFFGEFVSQFTKSGEQLAKITIAGMSSAQTKEEKMKNAKFAEEMALWMRDNPEEKKKYWEVINKELGSSGKKLSPFGLSEAGAASQLQQMGGGDVFGAQAFSPLNQIVDNTKQIAENTTPPRDEMAKPIIDNIAR